MRFGGRDDQGTSRRDAVCPARPAARRPPPPSPAGAAEFSPGREPRPGNRGKQQGSPARGEKSTPGKSRQSWVARGDKHTPQARKTHLDLGQFRRYGIGPSHQSGPPGTRRLIPADWAIRESPFHRVSKRGFSAAPDGAHHVRTSSQGLRPISANLSGLRPGATSKVFLSPLQGAWVA